jgi:hypothetical protein
MAPEQVRGEKITSQTDLYAAGIILYQMLSGRTPFASDNPTDTLLKQVSAAPPPLGARGSDGALPSEVDALIAALLAKPPQDRPASAGEVLERSGGIEVLLRDAPAARGPAVPAVSRTISVPPPRTISGPRPRASTRRVWLSVLGVATSAASGAFFLHAALAPHPRPEASATLAAAVVLEPAQPSAAPTPPADSPKPAPWPSRRANDDRWVQRGEALLAAEGLSMADLGLEPRLQQLWNDLDASAARGDSTDADRVLERLGDAMTAFDYPRVLLRKKITRLYAHLAGPAAPAGARLTRALLDVETARLGEALATRQRRRDLWSAVTGLEARAGLAVRPARSRPGRP